MNNGPKTETEEEKLAKKHAKEHQRKLREAERYATGEFTECPPDKGPEDY